jgi:hypothetical protein
LAKDKRSAEFVCYDVECLDVVEHNGRIQLFDNDWGVVRLNSYQSRWSTRTEE